MSSRLCELAQGCWKMHPPVFPRDYNMRISSMYTICSAYIISTCACNCMLNTKYHSSAAFPVHHSGLFFEPLGHLTTYHPPKTNSSPLNTAGWVPWKLPFGSEFGPIFRGTNAVRFQGRFENPNLLVLQLQQQWGILDLRQFKTPEEKDVTMCGCFSPKNYGEQKYLRAGLSIATVDGRKQAITTWDV